MLTTINNFFKNNLANIVVFLLVVMILDECILSTTLDFDYNLKFFRRVTRIAHYLFLLAFVYYFFIKKNFLCDLKKTYLIVLVISLLLAITFKKDWFLFDLFCIPIVFGSYLERKNIYNVLFFVLVIFTFCVIIGDLFDFLPKYQYQRESVIRYNLGFSHPNTLGLFFIIISMCYVLKKERLTISGYLFLFFNALFCWLIPNSVTATLIIILLIFIGIVSNLSFAQNVFLNYKKVIYQATVVFCLLTIFLIYIIAYTEFGRTFIENLPGSLWARFHWGMEGIKKYGISLFGQDIGSVSENEIKNGADASSYFVVDCAYFYFPIYYGLVPYILYLFFNFSSIKQSIEFNNIKQYLVILVVFFYGVSEHVLTIILFIIVYLQLYKITSNSYKTINNKTITKSTTEEQG